MEVYVVQHVHVVGNEEDIKMIGVYSTRLAAEAAVARLSAQPGFCDHLDGFHVSPYEVDKDHWTEGFISSEEALK